MPTSAIALLAATGRVTVLPMVVARVEVTEVRVPMATVKGAVAMAVIEGTEVEASVGLPLPDSNSGGV
tara:strand:- start:339 stop:542 length:204 start_codon:yes stop_codon:yes gene_type:complete